MDVWNRMQLISSGRRIDERTVEDFFFDDGIYRVRSEFQVY